MTQYKAKQQRARLDSQHQREIEHAQQMMNVRQYIDAAPTQEERQRRKREMYVHLYSCPCRLMDTLNRKKGI